MAPTLDVPVLFSISHYFTRVDGITKKFRMVYFKQNHTFNFLYLEVSDILAHLMWTSFQKIACLSLKKAIFKLTIKVTIN